MNVIRRTKVLIKTERKTFIRRQFADRNIFCEKCGGQMISAQLSADSCAVSSREIYRLIESGKIHFAETETNEIYVCPLSVNQILQQMAEHLLSESSAESETTPNY